ncbi:MAG: hypothetical protein E7660_05525 [Ruminococcaceae bacterium]|nr:hypothetical protein [Oscillospiraceae bacterium]
MSTLIIIIIASIIEVFNLLLLKLYKKKSLAVISIVFGALILLNGIMLFQKVQLVPFALGCEIGLALIAEFICVAECSKELRAISAAVLTVFAIVFLFVGQTSYTKEFDGKEYMGLYSRSTGFGETKVTYYEKLSPPFISSKGYCVENYGIILGDADLGSLEPVSIEYAN